MKDVIRAARTVGIFCLVMIVVIIILHEREQSAQIEIMKSALNDQLVVIQDDLQDINKTVENEIVSTTSRLDIIEEEVLNLESNVDTLEEQYDELIELEESVQESLESTEDTPQASENTEEASAEQSGEYLTFWNTCTISYYCNCSLCCGQWAGGNTASGTVPTAGRTVACGALPFGTRLMINNHEYVVEDRGVEGAWIDIYVDSHEEALALGLQTADVYIIN